MGHAHARTHAQPEKIVNVTKLFKILKVSNRLEDDDGRKKKNGSGSKDQQNRTQT